MWKYNMVPKNGENEGSNMWRNSENQYNWYLAISNMWFQIHNQSTKQGEKEILKHLLTATPEVTHHFCSYFIDVNHAYDWTYNEKD